MFALSGQPVIGLELKVTNLPSDPAQPQADGDDAHEAQLLVTLPAALHYSGVRGLDPVVRTWGRVAVIAYSERLCRFMISEEDLASGPGIRLDHSRAFV